MRTTHHFRTTLLLTALLAVLGGCAGSGKKPTVGDAEIREGLRTALKQGVLHTTGMVPGIKTGGPFPALFPKPLKQVTSGLRAAGMGGIADQFTALMNSGVEGLIRKGTSILVNAIEKLPLKDARSILFGGDTAATDYFRNLARVKLLGEFGREIRAVLDPVGATGLWKKAVGLYNSLPLGKPLNPDLAAFLADEALKQLFAGIAETERRIRRDVRARKDALLKRVFGLQDRR